MTFSTLTTFLLLTTKGQFSIDAALHYLGLWPIAPTPIVQSLCLTLTLYLGPLYNDIYLERSLSPLSEIWPRLVTTLSSSMGYRNYIAGPLTEELLFRSTILPVHILSPLSKSPKRLIFLTPLYFGIAHIHHFYEFRLSHPDTALTPALFRTIFQFAYTTIFGWYAAFVYLRTGNLYAVFIIHAFCNYMGLPRLWGKVSFHSPSTQRQFRVMNTRPVIRGKDDAEVEPLSTDSTGKARSDHADTPAFSRRLDQRTKHTVIYYALLLTGVFGFARWLFPLTNFKDLALVKFGR